MLVVSFKPLDTSTNPPSQTAADKWLTSYWN